MPTDKKTEQFDFEKSLKKLNTLVDTMEQGNLNLKTSLQHFESGIKLIRECQEALSTAEQKVQILTQQNGRDTLEGFLNND